jgi:hypothetical protein
MVETIIVIFVAAVGYLLNVVQELQHQKQRLRQRVRQRLRQH